MSQEFEQLKIKIEQRPCHICGNREFEWGYVDSYYQPRLVVTPFDKRRHLLASRKCLRCGNVQMFADEQSTKKARSLGCWVGLAVLVFVFFVISPLSKMLIGLILFLVVALTGA